MAWRPTEHPGRASLGQTVPGREGLSPAREEPLEAAGALLDGGYPFPWDGAGSGFTPAA